MAHDIHNAACDHNFPEKPALVHNREAAAGPASSATREHHPLAARHLAGHPRFRHQQKTD